MLLVAALAAIALAHTVVADAITSSPTLCTTSFGYEPLSAGKTVTTWLNKTTTTNYFVSTFITRNVITITPSAATSTGLVTTTTVLRVTTTSTPLPTTIPTPAGFLPLFAYNPNPTAISRAIRFDIAARDYDMALDIFKRQTKAGNSGGFSVARNGSAGNIYRKYPHRVDCKITYTVNETSTTTVTGSPETRFVAGPTAMVMSTITISTTTTLTVVAPRRTRYAACLENNVVNSVPGMTGEDIVFNRVIYRPSQGFPEDNELVTGTATTEGCCIACQNTPYCAGSFFVPSQITQKLSCHLRLTQPPPPPLPQLPSAPYPYHNATKPGVYPTYPTALGTAAPTGIIRTASTGIVATGTSPATPISTAGPGTCAKGSLSLYLGTIQGEVGFPLDIALSFSNGRCGRYSVWPVPVGAGLDTTLQDRRVKRLELE